MKLHILTIGSPKLAYAKAGWQEYYSRLSHHHKIRFTHLADKHANDPKHILKTAGGATKIALSIGAQQMGSLQLAKLLETKTSQGKEVCFIVGGPNGLPQTVIDSSDHQWSLSKLTFPHDLATVILLESLYRASSINAGLPYHK